jgi:hypothetical protein
LLIFLLALDPHKKKGELTKSRFFSISSSSSSADSLSNNNNKNNNNNNIIIMEERTGFQLSNFQPVASLALQGFTALMVYQMMVMSKNNKRGGVCNTVDEDDGGKETAKSQSELPSPQTTVSATEQRSIRGTNIYGPYKKVSRVLWCDVVVYH